MSKPPCLNIITSQVSVHKSLIITITKNTQINLLDHVDDVSNKIFIFQVYSQEAHLVHLNEYALVPFKSLDTILLVINIYPKNLFNHMRALTVTTINISMLL